MPNTSLPADEIRRRARWYVNVRWLYLLGIGVPAIVTLVIAFGFGRQVRQDIWLLSNVLVINGLFMLSTYIRVTSAFVGRILAGAQIFFDLLLMSMAFLINGGGETPLAMFFAIPIVMTAAFFGRRAIYTVGLSVAGLYASLTLLDYAGAIHPLNVAAPQLHYDPKLVFPALVAVTAILLAITVITDLVGRLIREREQLASEMRALTALHAQTEAILRTMGSALVAVDRAGKIMLVNRTFEKLTGWRRSEAVGQPLDDILPILDIHERRVPAAHRPMLQFLSDNRAEKDVGLRTLDGYSYVRKDGTAFAFIGNVAPIFSSKRIVGFTTVFSDATEARKLETLKDNFIALVSHQLKTPIGEINGFAYNLLSGIGGELSPKQAEYVTLIQEQAARSGQLIVDLLDIVLAGKGSMTVHNEPVEVSSVIKQVADQQRGRIERKGLKLVIEQPEGSTYVRADGLKVAQVLNNLINNAVAYSKRGAITVSVQPNAEFVDILVADTGRGMDAATVDALFGAAASDGPLSRPPTAEGGTGLGVFLAKQLVGLMKGNIQLVSSSKKGTVICVHLPRLKQQL